MSALATAKSVVSHRGISCLELHRKLGELTRQVTRLTLRAEQATALEARNDEQAQTIGSLREQLASAKDIRDDVHAKAVRCDEAEAKATAAEKALTEQAKELTELRAFRSNVNAVTVPQIGARDVDPDDHPTEPTGIDVSDLRNNYAAGVLTLQQAHCIGPVLDPGHAAT